MNKPTPGPWGAKPHKTFTGMWEITQKNEIPYVAVCSERDARLIAAAPDLLEALTEYIRLFEAHCITNHSTDDKDFTGYLAEKARAAIAKATGEE